MHLVPCDGPKDIDVLVIDERTVNITWATPPCRDLGDILYFYIFYTDLENKDRNLEWNVRGVYGDRNSTTLSNIIPGAQYKAYMVQSRLLGNGPPSSRFYFHTPAASKSLVD